MDRLFDKDVQMERVERLLKELEYELFRQVGDGTIPDKWMEYRKYFPFGKRGMVFEMRLRPIQEYEFPYEQKTGGPRLKIVEDKDHEEKE